MINSVFGLLIVFVMSVFIHSQFRMLNYHGYEDEFETMIASKMVVSGGKIYQDVFSQHGPLVFAFGYIVNMLNDASLAAHRSLISGLQILLVLLMVVYSKNITVVSKLFATLIVTTIMIVIVPDVYGNDFLYQVFAGIFLAIALTLLVLPSLEGGQEVSVERTAMAGVLLGSLPFLAFTYGPTAAGLLACTSNRRTWRPLAAGALSATALNLAFVAIYGSLRGFLADHLYFNAIIYPPYGDNSFTRAWILAKHSLTIRAIILLIFVVVVTAEMVRRRETSLSRGLIFGLSLASLLVRGPYMHAIPLYYAALPLVFTASRWIPTQFRVAQVAMAAIGLACIVKMSLILPSDLRRIQAAQVPEHSEFGDLVDKFTKPDDRIVSYSDANLQYLIAHRLPAVPNYFFLPSQAEYEKRPFLGFESHICRDLRDSRPKFVSLDKWQAWGKFPWTSYGACVDSIMDEAYVHLDGTTIYVRKDLWPVVKQAMNARKAPG